MKKNIVATVTLLLGCLVLIASTSLDGTWTGTLKTPDGGVLPLKYIFKTDGNKLTGAAATGRGDITINDGTVSGPDFSFTIIYNSVEVKNTGKFYPDADSVSLNVDYNGMLMHSTMKRATDQ